MCICSQYLLAINSRTCVAEITAKNKHIFKCFFKTECPGNKKSSGFETYNSDISSCLNKILYTAVTYFVYSITKMHVVDITENVLQTLHIREYICFQFLVEYFGAAGHFFLFSSVLYML